MKAPIACAATIFALAVLAGVVDQGCGRGLPESLVPVASADAGGVDPQTACEIAADTIVVIGRAQGLTCQEIKAQLEMLVAGPTPCRQFFGDARVEVVCE